MRPREFETEALHQIGRDRHMIGDAGRDTEFLQHAGLDELDFFPALPVVQLDALGAFQQKLAGRRQEHAPRRPLEQLRSEIEFDAPDRLGQRRLRQADLVGGGGEVAGTRDGQESPEISIHIIPKSYCLW